jgi:hypothetical protein
MNIFQFNFKILGDSKWLRINMATMYESVCGNCVSVVGWGRVDICMTFHMRAFVFFLYRVIKKDCLSWQYN